jgi:hypothetical protein
MVYRSSFRPSFQQARDGSIQMPTPPDSAPLLRVDLDTRKADTIASLKLARVIPSQMTMPNGGMMTMMMSAPLPTIDDWSLLSDGSIAILRGRDYHIDWILPDGTKKSTDRIPFEWKRLTDDDKLAMADSITKARATAQAGGGPGGGPMMMGDGGGMRISMSGGGGGGGRGDVERVAMAGVVAGAMGGAAPPPAAASSASTGSASTPPAAKPGEATAKAPAANGNAPANAAANAGGAPASASAGAGAGAASPAPAGAPMGGFAPPALAASDLPDYMPPFAFSSARPDADAHLWVRTTTPGSAPGTIVYDVIDNKGQLTDRVEVPRGMVIVGFGRGGVVFLTDRRPDGIHLVRATVR